jgi:DUF1365 family protein
MTFMPDDSAMLACEVIHHRVSPRQNRFRYGVFYLIQDIDRADKNTNLMLLEPKDHGFRDGSSLRSWADTLLASVNLADRVERVLLVAMPRILGYQFNPISFWLCLDSHSRLVAVLCEVNNTYGESHTYICCKSDHSIIEPDDRLEASKVFHVSPFLDRVGTYRFNFRLEQDHLAFHINYFDDAGSLQLRTILSGKLLEHTHGNELKMRFRYPLVTIKSIALIHLQAVILACKRITFRPKPKQLEPPFSISGQKNQRYIP